MMQQMTSSVLIVLHSTLLELPIFPPSFLNLCSPLELRFCMHRKTNPSSLNVLDPSANLHLVKTTYYSYCQGCGHCCMHKGTRSHKLKQDQRKETSLEGRRGTTTCIYYSSLNVGLFASCFIMLQFLC